MAQRDIVRALPNMRLDLGDFEALQRNERSDTRSQFAGLMYGSKTTVADLKRIMAAFTVQEDGGGPSAEVEVLVGVGTGAEDLPDGTQEYGVIFGREVQTQQNVDFTGQPANTYGIWVRFSLTPGNPGNRVFWNATTSLEQTGSLDTRSIADWDVTFATSSPGDEYQKIADVVWDGVSIDNADITDTQFLFWEGDLDATAPVYGGIEHVWGDGANDRNADRAQYGVQDLYTFAHLVRRQLEEIMDSALSDRWYAVPPYSLQDALDHANDSSNPHGASLTQTNLDLENMNDADDVTLKAASSTVGMLARELVFPTDIKYALDTNNALGGSGSPSINMAVLNDSVNSNPKYALTFDTLSNARLNFLVPLRFPGGHPNGDVATCDIQYITCDLYVDDNGGSSITMTVKVVEVETSGTNVGDFTDVITWNAVTAASSGGWARYFDLTGYSGLDTGTYHYFLQIEIDDTSATVGAELGICLIDIGYDMASFAHTNRTEPVS